MMMKNIDSGVYLTTRKRPFVLLCVAISLSLMVVIIGTSRYYSRVHIIVYHQGYQSVPGGRAPCEDMVRGCNATPQTRHLEIMKTSDQLYLRKLSQTLYDKSNATQLNRQSFYISSLGERDRSHYSSQRQNPHTAHHLQDSHNLSSTHHNLSHTHHNISHAQTEATGRYVMTITVEEQLCCAIYDLYQLANVANSWNMTLVEPYVEGSLLKFPSSPPAVATPKTLKYRDLIDLNETDNLFKQCLKSRDSIVTPFEAFADTASTIEHVVVIYLKQFDGSAERCANQLVHDANELKRRVGDYIKLELASRGKENVNFDTVPHTVVCVDIRKDIDFHHLLDSDPRIKLVTRAHSSILILIPKWRGIRTRFDKFFYLDRTYKQPSCPLVHSIPLSKRVQSAAEKYRKFLQLEHPYIGVHIRLERVVRMSRHKAGYTSECVKEFLRILQEVLERYNASSHQAVAFADYSDLGSLTCRDLGCRRIADKLGLDQKLHTLGVKLEQFDPAKFGEPSVSGYVAMTELELLSRADYLVTLGHGSYHRKLTQRFYINHESNWTTKKLSVIEGGDGKTVFAVCSSTKPNH